MTHTPVCHLPFGGGIEGVDIMKKTYMMPALQVNEVQAESMTAVSLINVSADPNGEVLVKQNNGWEIWYDEE